MAEYHVENFGCRASRADGEAIGAELSQRGLIPAGSAATADVVVMNTCSVTAQADRSARAFLRRLQRKNPNARVLVTGCYAQRVPGEVAALPGVYSVVGNSHKALVPGLAATAAFVPAAALLGAGSTWPGLAIAGPARSGPAIHVDELFAHSMLAVAEPGGSPGQTRPNLKVQDGCGNRCTFCVIPATRGPSRSLSLESCLRSVDAFVAGGGKELVVSGINLGRWGRDLTPAATLEQLVSAILARTSLMRLRLSSIEPMDLSPRLLELFQEHATPYEGRMARHVHLPLQSGSDTILRLMHRRYRPWHYAEKVDYIRSRMPNAAIGADVMVGFPGESDALFEESFAFIASQPFTYLHLFPFSPRPDTPGWDLHRQSPVPPQAVEERLERLRQLIAEKNRSFRQGFVGRELPAITLQTPEHELRQGFTRALSDNFLKLRIAGPLPSNRSLQVLVSMAEDGELDGRIVATPGAA